LGLEELVVLSGGHLRSRVIHLQQELGALVQIQQQVPEVQVEILVEILVAQQAQAQALVLVQQLQVQVSRRQGLVQQ
jgi:hypothetical protein